VLSVRAEEVMTKQGDPSAYAPLLDSQNQMVPAARLPPSKHPLKTSEIAANSAVIHGAEYLPKTSGTVSSPLSAQTTAGGTSVMRSMITSCGKITQNGTYSLFANLVGSGSAPCLVIDGATDVTLNCFGYSIMSVTGHAPVLQVQNSRNVTVKSCNVLAPTTQDGDFALAVTATDHFTVTGSTISGLSLARSTNAQIVANHLTAGVLETNGQNNQIQSNRIDTPQICSQGIASWTSVGSQFIGNTIDGHWNGDTTINAYHCTSSDNGILLAGQSGGRVDGNTISNEWDCGIESYGTVSGTSMNGNHITNTGNCGIGGWYLDAFENNSLGDNDVMNAGSLFNFYRSFGFSTAHPDVIFRNNSIVGNAFNSSRYGVMPKNQVPSASFNFSNLPLQDSSGLKIGNNLFQGNDFNPQLAAPQISAGLAVDGGDNLFGPTPPGSYPLEAMSSASTGSRGKPLGPTLPGAARR
jgi:parallel beta-helix repeat protein